MTQQQVFSLYLANPNQRVMHKDETKTLKLYGVAVDDECVIEHGVHSTGANISDCKLILKRVSDMSEGDKRTYELLLLNVAFEIGKGIYREANLETLQLAINAVGDFLRENGYCIDESWITNGWVEIESEGK